MQSLHLIEIEFEHKRYWMELKIIGLCWTPHCGSVCSVYNIFNAQHMVGNILIGDGFIRPKIWSLTLWRETQLLCKTINSSYTTSTWPISDSPELCAVSKCQPLETNEASVNINVKGWHGPNKPMFCTSPVTNVQLPSLESSSSPTWLRRIDLLQRGKNSGLSEQRI